MTGSKCPRTMHVVVWQQKFSHWKCIKHLTQNYLFRFNSGRSGSVLGCDFRADVRANWR